MSMPLDAKQKKLMLESADFKVDYFESKLKEAVAELEAYEATVEDYRQQRDRAVATRSDLYSDFKEDIEVASRSPYAGLGLRDALQRLIMAEEGRAITFTEMLQRLEDAGYEIASAHPSRSMHAALMHADGVERVERATYRWVGKPTLSPGADLKALYPPTQDRSEEEGRGNAEQGRLSAIDQ